MRRSDGAFPIQLGFALSTAIALVFAVACNLGGTSGNRSELVRTFVEACQAEDIPRLKSVTGEDRWRPFAVGITEEVTLRHLCAKLDGVHDMTNYRELETRCRDPRPGEAANGIGQVCETGVEFAARLAGSSFPFATKAQCVRTQEEDGELRVVGYAFGGIVASSNCHP
jgi:hypothetical protein